MTESETAAARPTLRWYQFRLRTLLAWVTVVAVICSCLASRRDLATWYAARQLRNASTPEEELAACKRIKQWVYTSTYGYYVEVKGASGNRIGSSDMEWWDSPAVVEITWTNGTTVRREILDHRTPSYLVDVVVY